MCTRWHVENVIQRMTQNMWTAWRNPCIALLDICHSACPRSDISWSAFIIPLCPILLRPCLAACLSEPSECLVNVEGSYMGDVAGMHSHTTAESPLHASDHLPNNVQSSRRLYGTRTNVHVKNGARANTQINDGRSARCANVCERDAARAVWCGTCVCACVCVSVRACGRRTEEWKASHTSLYV